MTLQSLCASFLCNKGPTPHRNGGGVGKHQGLHMCAFRSNWANEAWLCRQKHVGFMHQAREVIGWRGIPSHLFMLCRGIWESFLKIRVWKFYTLLSSPLTDPVIHRGLRFLGQWALGTMWSRSISGTLPQVLWGLPGLEFSRHWAIRTEGEEVWVSMPWRPCGQEVSLVPLSHTGSCGSAGDWCQFSREWCCRWVCSKAALANQCWRDREQVVD